MAQRYNLRQWQPARDSELVSTLVKATHPEYHTGITVHCWGGWRWTHTDEYGDTREYRTSTEGDGLWIMTSQGWNQLTGTCQFTLSQDRQKAIRELRQAGLAPDPIA